MISTFNHTKISKSELSHHIVHSLKDAIEIAKKERIEVAMEGSSARSWTESSTKEIVIHYRSTCLYIYIRLKRVEQQLLYILNSLNTADSLKLVKFSNIKMWKISKNKLKVKKKEKKSARFYKFVARFYFFIFLFYCSFKNLHRFLKDSIKREWVRENEESKNEKERKIK